MVAEGLEVGVSFGEVPEIFVELDAALEVGACEVELSEPALVAGEIIMEGGEFVECDGPLEEGIPSIGGTAEFGERRG